jgi:hypothetical protein
LTIHALLAYGLGRGSGPMMMAESGGVRKFRRSAGGNGKRGGVRWSRSIAEAGKNERNDDKTERRQAQCRPGDHYQFAGGDRMGGR